jgi:CRP-like cAMP-binding protein
VKLTRAEPDGKQVIVALRHAGWLLGASSLLLGTRYAATAETLTRCKLCFIPPEMMTQAMDTDARFSRWISTIFGREVHSGLLSISERSCLSGRQRLEKFFRELAQAQSGPDLKRPTKIQMVLKNWEVAQLLALTPQHLSRLIKELEVDGIITRKKGWLILPEPERIRRVAIQES